MKNKIIYIIALTLFVSLGMIVADILLTTDTSIELTKEQKQTLERVGTGIVDISVSEMICNGKDCKVNLYKKGAINKDIRLNQYWTNCTFFNETLYECQEEEIIYYTNEELLEMRDNKIKSILEMIADTKIEREQRQYETKLGEGIVTIGEGDAPRP